MRPMCNECNMEALLLSDMTEIKAGVSVWNDLTDCRGKCYTCDKDVDIAWGFLCTAVTNNKVCPVRRISSEVGRQMIVVYRPGRGL